MEIENISGSPRAFVAAYAKDIVIALVQKAEMSLSEGAIEDKFNLIADYIYGWVMQDSLKGITDKQITAIEELLINASISSPHQEKVRENLFNYTVGEASDLIEHLKNNQIPLKDQNRNYTQGEIRQMTREAAERDCK